MKSIKNQIIFVLLFLPFFGLSQEQSLAQAMQKYQPYMGQLNQGYGILEQKDGVREFATVGDFDFTEHSVFNIGSATKKLTAILLLQEMEKGNLQLTDSIGQYLQPIKNVDGGLTIESLLRHRTGLGEIAEQNFERDFFAQSDSIYNSNFLETIPEPNLDMVGKYQYCNTNYILLGHILETVTDQSFQDLLRERIFEPCQMENSSAYISKRTPNLVPPTHMGQDVSEYLDYRFFYNYAFSAGSVASTVHDMALFYEHLFHKGTLLTEPSIEKLVAFDDANYGLGVMQFADGYIGHGGNNIGYSYREFYNPETKDMVLLFTNSMELPFYSLLKQDAFAYLNQSESEVEFNQAANNEFASKLGKYLFDEQGMQMEFELKEKDGFLYLNAQGLDVLMSSTEKGKLTSALYGIRITEIAEDADGLTFGQGGLETTIKRINE